MPASIRRSAAAAIVLTVVLAVVRVDAPLPLATVQAVTKSILRRG